MPRPTNTQFAVAVHVLTYVASMGDSGQVSSEELAASTNVNAVYVRRVLGPLREAGLVRSRPGSGGGWVLCRPAADIPLDEVWSILQGDDPVLGLHGPNPKCPVGAGVQRVLEGVDRDVARAVVCEQRGDGAGDVVDAIDAAGMVARADDHQRRTVLVVGDQRRGRGGDRRAEAEAVRERVVAGR